MLCSSRLYFHSLAVVALVLLWGVGWRNGTVEALLVAVRSGQFKDGTQLKTDYTGVLAIDLPISLLVAFFFSGTNGQHPGYQHFLLDAYSTLQSAFVWLYVESARNQFKPASIKHPVLWGLIWQAFGAAISLPLYFAEHLRWLDQSSFAPQAIDESAARAIPFSFIIGALIPAVVGMLPTWLGPAHRSTQRQQTILAAWQLDPLWVSGIQSLIIIIARKLEHSKYQGSHRWVRRALLLAAFSSAIGHTYVMGFCIGSTEPSLSFSRMYVPLVFDSPKEKEDILLRGPWLFLQFDLIIITLSSLSWIHALLSRLVPGETVLRPNLILALTVGALTIGPGATVSLGLAWREEKLQRLREAGTEAGTKMTS